MTDAEREEAIKAEGKALAFAFAMGDAEGAKRHNEAMKRLMAGRSLQQKNRMERALKSAIERSLNAPFGESPDEPNQSERTTPPGNFQLPGTHQRGHFEQ